jgi:nickel/cobalt exporter
MTTEFSLLLGTAATLGLVHTLLGPDHYVPFIAMAKARNWSGHRTFLVTLLCGIGHVGSSALIGVAGLLFGTQVLRLQAIESLRGSLAGWLLLGFGLAYMVWGVRRAVKTRAPVLARFEDGEVGRGNILPWILFTVFIFGPCEPLIPVLMYPAATSSWLHLITVTSVFALFTIGTMMALVFASLRGLAWLPTRSLERYSHALAGFVVLMCGVGMKFLGL